MILSANFAFCLVVMTGLEHVPYIGGSETAVGNLECRARGAATDRQVPDYPDPIPLKTPCHGQVERQLEGRRCLGRAATLLLLPR